MPGYSGCASATTLDTLSRQCSRLNGRGGEPRNKRFKSAISCSQAGRLTIAAAGRCNATLLAAGRFRGMLLHYVILSSCLHTFPCTSATLQPVCIRYVVMCVFMHPSTCPNSCRTMQPSIYLPICLSANETFTSSLNVSVGVSVSMYP